MLIRQVYAGIAASVIMLTMGLTLPAAAAANEPADIQGRWLTEKGKVAVELETCGAELCGKIIWLAKPYTKSGELKRDGENPDPALRDRPWCGITVITGLRPKKRKPGVWEDGTFYFPKDGRRYDIEIKKTGDALRVYAFLGIKLFGKKETWRRVEDPIEGCVEES